MARKRLVLRARVIDERAHKYGLLGVEESAGIVDVKAHGAAAANAASTS